MSDKVPPRQGWPDRSTRESYFDKRRYILEAETHARPSGEVDQPLVERLSVGAQPTFWIEGIAVFENFFATMYEVTAHSDDTLYEGSDVWQGAGYGCVRTPPGTNFPAKVAPTGGTTRGNGENTPGLILMDSLITPICVLNQWTGPAPLAMVGLTR